MPPYTIELAPYSPEWPKRFTREADALRQALGPVLIHIEHIGSTAVPGARAKPIIDIAVLIASVERMPELIPALTTLSYQYLGEFGLPGRHFFIKGDPRAYHVHIVDSRTDHWRRWITFRDILRRDSVLLKRYEKLKTSLVEIYHTNREKYTAAKSAFINAVVEGRCPPA